MFGRCVGQYPANEARNLKPKYSLRVSSFAAQTDNVPSITTGNDNSKCECCGATHNIDECQSFSNMTPENRRKLARANRLCDNCLRPFHFAIGCMARPACTMDCCGRRQHTLLHSLPYIQSSRVLRQTMVNTLGESVPEQDIDTGSVNFAAVPKSGDTGDTVTNFNTRFSNVQLRVVPVMVGGPHAEVETLALLDEGSQITLCSIKLAGHVGLNGEEDSICMTTLHGTSNLPCFKSNISVRSQKGNEAVEMCVTAIDIPMSCNLPTTRDISRYSHLQDIEFGAPSLDNSEVMLLIGGDVPEVFWVMEDRRGGKEQPYAVKTVLGWNLIWPVRAMSSPVHDALMDQVTRFPEIDFGGNLMNPKKDIAESEEDSKARKNMASTFTLNEEGHCKMGLPCSSSAPCLPYDHSIAMPRLNTIRKKFVRDEDMVIKSKA